MGGILIDLLRSFSVENAASKPCINNFGKHRFERRSAPVVITTQGEPTVSQVQQINGHGTFEIREGNDLTDET